MIYIMGAAGQLRSGQTANRSTSMIPEIHWTRQVKGGGVTGSRMVLTKEIERGALSIHT